MRQKGVGKKNWTLRTAAVLLVMVLVSARMISEPYARFAVSDSASDSAKVASFAFVTQDGTGSKYLNFNEIQKPGDEQSYVFTVSNKNGSIVSEVTEQVRFDVQLNGSMPLECTVFKGTAPLSSLSISERTTALPVVNSDIDAGLFPASTEQTDTYTLKVVWPAGENSAKYASRSAVAEVVLTITAEQAD